MANAGPDTNGSQFFVVYGDTELPPDYTVFGTVDDAGIKVVEGIADKGVRQRQWAPATEHRTSPSRSKSVSVS